MLKEACFISKRSNIKASKIGKHEGIKEIISFHKKLADRGQIKKFSRYVYPANVN